MQTGVAKLPLFGSAAKAFQFLFVQRAGTTDPPVEGVLAQTGNTRLIQERSVDRRFAQSSNAVTQARMELESFLQTCLLPYILKSLYEMCPLIQKE